MKWLDKFKDGGQLGKIIQSLTAAVKKAMNGDGEAKNMIVSLMNSQDQQSASILQAVKSAAPELFDTLTQIAKESSTLLAELGGVVEYFHSLRKGGKLTKKDKEGKIKLPVDRRFIKEEKGGKFSVKDLAGKVKQPAVKKLFKEREGGELDATAKDLKSKIKNKAALKYIHAAKGTTLHNPKCATCLKRLGGILIEVDSCTGLPVAKRGMKIKKAQPGMEFVKNLSDLGTEGPALDGATIRYGKGADGTLLSLTWTVGENGVGSWVTNLTPVDTTGWTNQEWGDKLNGSLVTGYGYDSKLEGKSSPWGFATAEDAVAAGYLNTVTNHLGIKQTSNANVRGGGFVTDYSSVTGRLALKNANLERRLMRQFQRETLRDSGLHGAQRALLRNSIKDWRIATNKVNQLEAKDYGVAWAQNRMKNPGTEVTTGSMQGTSNNGGLLLNLTVREARKFMRKGGEIVAVPSIDYFPVSTMSFQLEIPSYESGVTYGPYLGTYRVVSRKSGGWLSKFPKK